MRLRIYSLRRVAVLGDTHVPFHGFSWHWSSCETSLVNRAHKHLNWSSRALLILVS